MPFASACTYCGNAVELPDGAVGTKYTCALCGYERRVKAPPAPPPPPPEPEPVAAAAEPEEPPAPPPPPPARPTPAPTAAGAGAARLTAWAPDPDAAEAAEGPLFPPAGVASVLLAGAALLAATYSPVGFLTRPLAGLGFVVGGLAFPLYWGSRGVPVTGGGAGLSLLVFLVAWAFPEFLGPAYEGSRQKSSYDPLAVRAVRLNPAPGESSAALFGPDGAADADRTAVEQGPVRVSVASVVVGPPPPPPAAEPKPTAPTRGKPAKDAPPPPPVLQIGLRLRHLGHAGPVAVRRWGTGEVPPAVAEAGGGPLAPAVGSGPPPPTEQELTPGRTLDVLLLYAPPPGPGSVRLTLPAAAWGGPGTVTFAIPAAMVGGPDRANAPGQAPGPPRPFPPFPPGVPR